MYVGVYTYIYKKCSPGCINKHGGTFLELFPRVRDQVRGNKCEYIHVKMFPRVRDQARGNKCSPGCMTKHGGTFTELSPRVRE